MKRREFTTLVGGAAAWSLTVHAQQSAMPVVGWLHPRSLNASREFLDGFRKGLREAGFVEEKNVMIELSSANGKRAKLPALADDLVRRGVSVIMAGSAPAALAAKRATQTIPVVFVSGTDPVKIGLVSNFGRPNGNVTGFHAQFTQLGKKRLALLHEAVPQTKRIAMLVNPAHPVAEQQVRDATQTAHALGLDFRVINAATIDEIGAAFAALVQWRAGAVYIGVDPLLSKQRKQIANLATEHALPTSGYIRSFVEAGGLMSYGPDLPDLYRRAGGNVGRILTGDKPTNLAVQQGTKFELAVNLKTTKALGITLPPPIMLSADRVIK